MNWKKNQIISEMFTYHTADRRNSFRIGPSEIEPILLKLGETEVRVIDIGAGGISFRSNSFEVGESQPVNFDLPGANNTASLTLEVVKIDDRNICHCRFTGGEKESVEHIHQYVLYRQKQIISEERKRVKKRGLSGRGYPGMILSSL